jgi:hypothetical protein
MAKADLHEFKEDLKNKPGKGSDAPPRTIRASDLDGNFKKVMLIESDDVDPPAYEVEYTEDGTMLKNLKQLPDGENLGDIAYYDPEAGNNGAGAWRVLAAPEGSTIKFKQFDVCENGQPKEYTMLVWDIEN